MAGRKKSVSVQEELLLCPSAKPGDWFPGIPVSAVAGIDEAGRGCLAGPVVAAAVILPEGAVIPGLADSKVLSPTRRDGLAAEIGAVALAWGLGVVWPPEIDRINILQATLKAMCHAASVLKVRPKGLLIDGNQTIPEPLFRQRAACWTSSPRQKSIVDGDALVPVISAASIIAKTVHIDHVTAYTSTTAIPAMVSPSIRATVPKSTLPLCVSLGRAPCTGRRSGAFCPNSRRRGRVRFCDLAAGKRARRRGCRRGLAGKGRDADTRPQLAQRFV